MAKPALPLLVLLVACGSKDEATSTPAEPITVEPAKLATPTTPPAPPKPVAPFFRITGCESDYSSEDPETDLFVKVDSGKLEMCRTFHGARAKLEVEANPGAQLTINGKTVAIPESGKLATIVELAEPVLGLTIDDVAVDSMHASKELVVPYKLQVGSSTLDGKLAFTESVGHAGKVARTWLAMVAEGKVDRPAFTAAKTGERRTIALIQLDGSMKMTDRRGTLRELDLVAIERETGREEMGTCDFESEGRVVRAKRFGVSLEVTVTSLVDGSVVATKAFPASPEGCPMFTMMDRANPTVSVRPDSKPILKWLDTLARPTT